MELQIDYRENQFISLWAASERGIPFNIVTLDVGDFCFQRDGQMMMVIERKTEADLQASISDGRWREQKERLDILRNLGVIVGFIIERMEKRDSLNFKLLDGAILNTLFRDNYPVCYTECIEHTIEYIEAIWKKLSNGDFQKQRGSSLEIKTDKLKKKMGKSDMFSLSLSTIPRVSLAIAEKIQERYPTMLDLARAYIELDGDATAQANLLADIEVGKKKLGKKLSSDIFGYISQSS
jgi:ERCC4-type nuclease